ncbi:unnamed protein product [Prorocentrum cordatum]|uniref:Uncharacterized protein n=1 Tax=Prorocentrum cordatum TaxID=2364126 RepID=A0ABN9XAM5_9DINO|nr:unnamed protein product [Polarella glacialis]
MWKACLSDGPEHPRAPAATAQTTNAPTRCRAGHVCLNGDSDEAADASHDPLLTSVGMWLQILGVRERDSPSWIRKVAISASAEGGGRPAQINLVRFRRLRLAK